MDNEENIVALNYSTHAIEGMKDLVNALPRHFVQSKRAIEVVSDMFRDSVKFILPNCAELLDPEHVSQALAVDRFPVTICPDLSAGTTAFWGAAIRGNENPLHSRWKQFALVAMPLQEWGSIFTTRKPLEPQTFISKRNGQL